MRTVGKIASLALVVLSLFLVSAGWAQAEGGATGIAIGPYFGTSLGTGFLVGIDHDVSSNPSSRSATIVEFDYVGGLSGTQNVALDAYNTATLNYSGYSLYIGAGPKFLRNRFAFQLTAGFDYASLSVSGSDTLGETASESGSAFNYAFAPAISYSAGSGFSGVFKYLYTGAPGTTGYLVGLNWSKPL